MEIYCFDKYLILFSSLRKALQQTVLLLFFIASKIVCQQIENNKIFAKVNIGEND